MTKGMQKSVSYSVAEHELVAAYRRQHLRTWKSPRALGQSALLLAVVWLVGIGVNIGHSGYDGAIGGATKFVGMILALMPLMYLLGYWLWGDYVKKQFRERPAMREGCDLNWSDDGFNLRSESIDSFMRWSSLLSWLQDDFGFQIYVAKNSFFWLPRRAFSAEQWDDLRETLVRSGLSGNGNEQTSSSPLRQGNPNLLKGRGSLWSRSSGVALLWIMLVLVSVTHFLFFPASWRGGIGNLFFVSTIPLVLGILGAAILRLRAACSSHCVCNDRIYVELFSSSHLRRCLWFAIPDRTDAHRRFDSMVPLSKSNLVAKRCRNSRIDGSEHCAFGRSCSAIRRIFLASLRASPILAATQIAK
jgi:YcxB-like protein